MGILDDKTAFILGASAGIAQASARLLAADGAKLFLLGRSSKRLDATRDRIMECAPGAEIHVHKGDPEDEDTVKNAAQAAFDIAGRLDIVVGTVATGGTGPLVQQDLATFTGHVMGNLRSNFLALRYGAPLMTNGGSIVFVSSTSAKIPMEGLGHYSAGKAALEMLIKVAASELGGKGIRVNAVRPGLTEAATTQGYIHLEELTSSFLERVPLGRLGVSDDIAPAIRYLAGPESSWMTGQSFAVDGGNEVRGAPRGPMFTV
ncbi:SDR family oxidoreductase [Mycobacterium sp. 236(2023)]|uniref:SDR family NAD(P)-dependent oxidoreductase n=1 Tax=Mycobacterium sp. 236(2023) TaxID=3038163 RepID=UPI002415421B|nr:SDR family oxidoreductase [Mycobacterium sp. 236(2023)]MDG4669396.1 SDR family NAD(P)-dependent oxidoreductase [Mycobacterium sp. 236(2023)]